MRSRLLVPLVVFAVLAVAALVVPTANALARARTQQLQLDRGAAIGHIAELTAAALTAGDDSQLRTYLERFHDVYGESVLVVDGAGGQIALVGPLDADAPAVRARVVDALRNLPQRSVPTVTPWSDDTALLAEPVGSLGSTTVGAVVLEADLRAAKRDVLWSWLLAGAAAAALLFGLAFAAQRWVRWVLRPVQALDAAASAFPRRRRLEVTAGGPPELQHLAASVATMAAGMEEVLAQQRGFVADASHQLRNPLAAIRLRMDGLTDDDPGPAPSASHQDPDPELVREELSAVAADVERLDHIVDRMLTLATAEHRAHATSLGVSHWAENSRRDHTVPSAAALVDPVRDLARAAGLVLRTVGETPVDVGCRRSDLEEVLANLVENAGKYAGPGSTVTVTLRQVDDVAEIEVADDGPGVDPEELASLGTRFWRSARHSQLPGTGLGLAIVEQLVTANDGTVELGRVADGTGLRVVLRFEALS